MRAHDLATRRLRALRFRCAGSVGFVVVGGRFGRRGFLGLLGGGEVYKMRCLWTALLVGKLLPFLLTDYLSLGTFARVLLGAFVQPAAILLFSTS
jgi:hypothetical protein